MSDWKSLLDDTGKVKEDRTNSFIDSALEIEKDYAETKEGKDKANDEVAKELENRKIEKTIPTQQVDFGLF